MAGIEENNAIDYLKEQFISTGLNADKVIREAKNAYSKTIDLFGTERCKYKTYSEYKKSHWQMKISLWDGLIFFFS